jgi:hypothetical protein
MTAVVVVLVAGLAAVGLLLLMVRTHAGFARFDLAAARFGAAHATATSTRVMRLLTQLGGAVVLVPLTAVFGVVTARRQRAWPAIAGFLTH